MDNASKKNQIKQFLKSLTRREKLIVVLHYYEELTMREIAEVLELPRPEVSGTLSAIIKRCSIYLQAAS